jgi:hypothetical protein
VATSALGADTERDEETGLTGIQPANIRPRWVTVPMLVALARLLPEFVPRFHRIASPARSCADPIPSGSSHKGFPRT